ncbi:uncharacterized protein PAN0_015d5022, partial [Moesziomyces antarcticus]
MALLSKPSSNDGDHPGSQLPLGSPVSLSQFFAAARYVIQTTAPLSPIVHPVALTSLFLCSGDPAQASADADADADSDFDADTAIDPTAAAQLERFCLRLVDHPRLLVCTRKQCLLKLPLMPTFKEVSTHLKMQHHHALVASSKQVLVDVLETLDLDHPASVRINSSLLPVPIIKELDVTYQGYRCSLCPYTIKSKSAMHTHMHTHRDEEVKATYIHPVPMQVIYEGGQNRRYLHVINKELDPTPPTAILPAAAIADVDRAVQVKVWEMLRQNAQNMQDAKVDKPGVLPLTFTGNLGLWAKQLNWHAYWAGKQVAAVGRLGPNPQHWPGAHRDLVSWVLAMAKGVTLSWMTSLTSAGRQVQQMFHAHSAEVSQPYSLNDSTIKKRADTWAFMLALLVHLFLDGDVGSYAGQQSMEDHLCLDESV